LSSSKSLSVSDRPRFLLLAGRFAPGIACGAGHGSLFPVLNGLVVARTPARLHGVVVSLYTAALDAGAVIGTPLCGAIAHTAGYRVMFTTMAVASLAGLVLIRLDGLREHHRLAAGMDVAPDEG